MQDEPFLSEAKEMLSSLVNCATGDPFAYTPETILIVGNGAVENGNIPLKKAIKDNYSNLFDWEKDYKISNPDPATILANYAFVIRARRHELLKTIQANKFNDNFRQIIEVYFQFFNELRQSIAGAFKAATKAKEISLRSFPGYNYLKEPFAVISLNWDELLYKSTFFSKNLISLHGRVSNPDSLVLPVESTADDFVIEVFLNATSKADEMPWFTTVEQAFRPTNIRDQHEHADNVAQFWLAHAKKIIIWGVAFNAYDAEFMSIIPKPDTDHRKFLIINPDARARDVAGTMFGTNPRLRTDYDPIRQEWIKIDWINKFTNNFSS